MSGPKMDGGGVRKLHKKGRNKAYLLFTTEKQGRNKEMGRGNIKSVGKISK